MHRLSMTIDRCRIAELHLDGNNQLFVFSVLTDVSFSAPPSQKASNMINLMQHTVPSSKPRNDDKLSVLDDPQSPRRFGNETPTFFLLC